MRRNQMGPSEGREGATVCPVSTIPEERRGGIKIKWKGERHRKEQKNFFS